MANVMVLGGVVEEYGLKTAQKVQRVHNAQVASALLNVSAVGTPDGKPAHQDADRLPYVHQAYPMMLYKPDPGERGEKIVMNDVEKAIALQDGWREEPYPRLPVAIIDPAQERKNLLETNNNLQAQLAMMQEQFNKLMAQIQDGEPAKRGPGRPKE